jgi:hypothetical protein
MYYEYMTTQYFVRFFLSPVRVLHKDEKILGRKHIYLPHAQTAIYDSKVKLFLKQGISHPPKLAVVKTTSTMVDRLVEYFS